MAKESSDEKLLKIIESKTSVLPPISNIGFKKKSDKFGLPFKFFKVKARINLFNLNKGLFLAGFILTGILLYVFIQGARYSRSDFLFAAVKNFSAVTKIKQSENQAFLSEQEYTDILDRRNIFQQAGAANVESVDTVVITDLVKDLTLVGIIWSSNPEAMIEDAVEKKTYLLKKGDRFLNDRFKVKDVTRSSVLLDVYIGGQAKPYELR